MKQLPFFEMSPEKRSERLWAYLDNSLDESETLELERALKSSSSVREELEQCRKLSNSLGNYQQQAVPNWNPQSIFRVPVKAKKNWFPTAIAATALMVSLLPYIHLNENSISFGAGKSYVSNQQMEQAFDNFGFQQASAFSDRIEQLKSDQNIKNQELVVSILNYAEKKRRNDLLQMASWFSRQSELNQNQQRQIVNWVANEQQQDKQALNTLFNSISHEEQP